MRGILLGLLLACTDGGDSHPPGIRGAGVDETVGIGVPIELDPRPSSIGQAAQIDRSQLASGRPIIMVVIDTLRADHLSLYGHERETTPWIDALGRDGIWFSRAYAQSGWTLPSFTSLFSGLLPHQHRVGRDRQNIHLFGRLGPEVKTLAERLQEAGYRTAAVMNNTFLAPEFGLSQGFEYYDWQGASNQEYRSAEATVEVGLRWLQESDQAAFLVLHFMEPHANYSPSAAVRHRFTPEGVPPIPVPFQFTDGRRPEPYVGEALDYLLRLYDEEIADADRGVGTLIEGLKSAGIFDEAVVVVTADHGEEFWDHGHFEHGQNLYGELTRVPLLIHGPGLKGGEIDVVVEHLDLFETLLEIGGAEPSAPDKDSLFSIIDALERPAEAERLAHRTAISDNTLYGPPRLSIADFGHRFNLDQAVRQAEVWEVAEDGMERVRVEGASMKEESDRLQRQLFDRRGDLVPIQVDSQTGFTIDDRDVFEQLMLLGYLEE